MNSVCRSAFYFLVLLLLLAAQRSRGQVTNIDYALGREKYHMKNWVGAVTNLSAAIAASYELYNSYNYRAYARSKLGDKEGALADCAAATKLNPTFSGRHFWRAQIFLNLTNYDGALANYIAGMRIEPQYCPENLAADISAGFSRRWDECIKADNLAGAVTNLNVEIFLCPTNSNLYSMRSTMALFQKHYERALKDADTSLQFNQGQYIAHCNRAWGYLMLSDPVGAAGNCKLAFESIARHKQEAIKYGQTNSAEFWKSDVLFLEGLEALAKGEKAVASDKFKSSFECETWNSSNSSAFYRKHWRQLVDDALAKVPEKMQP